MRRLLVLLMVWAALTVSGTGLLEPQRLVLNYATFPTEITAFNAEGAGGRYERTGESHGVAETYFSASRGEIRFTGLRRITLKHIGQKPDDKFELFRESFIIEKLIRVTEGEYAFEAVNEGTYPRRATGTLKFKLGPSGVNGTVEGFTLEERGLTIEGVMNRYSLPTSKAATDLLAKHAAIFWGGGIVTLDLEN